MNHIVLLFSFIVIINAAPYQVIPAIDYEGDIYVPLSFTSLRVQRAADPRRYHGGNKQSQANANAAAEAGGFNNGFNGPFGPSGFGNFGKGNLGYPSYPNFGNGHSTAGAKAGASGNGNSDSTANAQTQTFQGNGFTGSASSASASSHSSGGGWGRHGTN